MYLARVLFLVLLSSCASTTARAENESPFLFRAAAEPAADAASYVIDQESTEPTLPQHVTVLRVLPGVVDLPLKAAQLTNVETVISEYWNIERKDSGLSGEVLQQLVSSPKLRKLRLREARQIGTEEIKLIAKIVGLEELDIQHIGNERKPNEVWGSLPDLSLLSQCTNLKRLRVGSVSPRQEVSKFFEQLSKLDTLESLHLVHCDVTAAGLVYLSRLTQLKELCLEDCHIKDQSLELIGEFFKLTDVSLNRSRGFTEHGIAKLFKMGTLKGLDIKLCDVEFPGLKDAKGIESLERLRVSGAWRTPPPGQAKTIEPHWTSPYSLCYVLQELPNFRALWFEDVPGDYYDTDSGWAQLSQLKGLEILSLKGCGELKEHACKAVSELPGLKELDLRGCILSKALVESVESLASLERLSFTLETGRSDHGIFGVLAKLKKLTELDVTGKNRPVLLLEAIASVPELKRLRLSQLTLGPLPDNLAKVAPAMTSIAVLDCAGLDMAGAQLLASVPSLVHMDLTETLNGQQAKGVRVTRKPEISIVWR